MAGRERTDFADLVRDALRHLDDPVCLMAHPLAAFVVDDPAVSGARDGAAARGRRLREELVGAIESLRPRGANGLADRRHQALALRYVEGLDAGEVAGRLAVGRSQYYLDHQAGLAAVVSLLRSRWQPGAPHNGTGPPLAPLAWSARLPTPLTTFVGRDRSVTAVRARLAAGRLVTLTGPPGTGKTRLALAVAQAMAADSSARRDFPDGIWFAPLAPVADAGAVLRAIVDALGAAVLPGASPLTVLSAHLRDRRLLLVLDNFEHVVAAAPDVSELLVGCPGVRVLVTSRTALGVVGEMEWPVPPLALPDPTQTPAVEQLGEYEAIALFVARAQAIRPAFTLTTENAPAVAEICRRLDGLPLAIELAAARVRVLSPAQIAARLDRSFRLFGDDGVGGPPHQRTLRAAMDWSYSLLTPDERRLFDRLAVFAGGWTLESADELCDGRALELTTALVGKSLVEVEPGEPPRYRLLELLRQYAQERLEQSGDVRSVRDWHLGWCRALCERTRPQDADPARVAEVTRELPNLRSAMRWAVESDQAEAGFQIVNSLTGFWYARGDYTEGRAWVDALLVTPAGQARTAARASALRTAGHLALNQCDFVAADRYQTEAAGIAAELGDENGLASAKQMRARLAAARGDLATAERLFEDVVAAEERLGRPTWLLFALVGLADVVTELRRDPDRASRLAERALALARELCSQQGIALAVRSLGRAAARAGDAGAASCSYLRALEIERALNNRHATAEILVDLADLAAAACVHEEARRRYHEGLRTAAEVRSWPEIARCLEGLAGLTVDAEPRRAAALAGAAAGIRARTGISSAVDGSVRREGLSLTLEEMLALAASSST